MILRAGKCPVNLDERRAPRRRLAQAIAVLVSAVFWPIGCRETLPSPAEDGVSCAVTGRADRRLSLLLQSPRAHYFVLPCSSAQTSSSREARPATLAEVLDQAEKAEQEGRLDVALEKCREALALDPKSAHAYYLLGVVEVEQGATEEAKQALLQSVRLDSSHIGAHIYLGKIYLLSKEWGAAKGEFQKPPNSATRPDRETTGWHWRSWGSLTMRRPFLICSQPWRQTLRIRKGFTRLLPLSFASDSPIPLENT